MSSGKSKSGFGSFLGIIGSAVGGWYGAIIILVGGVLANKGAKQQQREAEARARAARQQEPIRGNVRGSHEHHLMVFGKARVGGIVINVETSDGPDTPDQDLKISLAHSICHAGGCEGIEDIWIDDTRIESTNISGGVVVSGDHANVVTVTHYRGTSTQSFPRGVAWTEFQLRRPMNDEQLEAAYKFGIPICTVELKGIRCYDPRMDSTEGGAGSPDTVRHSDPTTWVWTSNPALCAATYMIMEESDGGMGIPADRMDWASVAAAANICDETVEFSGSPSQPTTRFVCNGVLKTSDTRETNLQKLLDSMWGRRVKVGGKYKLYAGAYTVPTITIDETWLAGSVRVVTKSPLEGMYNAVRINFDDATQDYKTVEAPPFTSATYETQDGGYRVWRDISLPMVSNTYNAQYISHIVGHQSRQQMILELTCNLKALDVEVWETATVSIPEVDLSGRVFRIMEWSFAQNAIQLTLQEEDSTVYDPEAAQGQTTGDAPNVGKITSTAPTNLSAGGIIDGIRLLWTPPPASVHDNIEVWRASDNGGSPSSAGTYTLLQTLPRRSSTYTDRVTDGSAFWYKVRATSNIGADASSYSNEATSTARTGAATRSDGDGVAVYDGADTDTNENVFLPVRAGFGMRVTRKEE